MYPAELWTDCRHWAVITPFRYIEQVWHKPSKTQDNFSAFFLITAEIKPRDIDFNVWHKTTHLWSNTVLIIILFSSFFILILIIFSSLSSYKLILSHLPQTLIPEICNSYFSNPFVFKRQLPYSQPASFPVLIRSTFTASQRHFAVATFVPTRRVGIQQNIICQLPSIFTIPEQSQLGTVTNLYNNFYPNKYIFKEFDKLTYVCIAHQIILTTSSDYKSSWN